MTKTTKKTTKAKPEPKEKKESLIKENTIVKLTVPKKTADEAYKKSLKKLAKTLKLDGFRKGNVPAKIAEEHLNIQMVIEEALKIVVPDIYNQEIKKADLHPIVYPEFKPVSLEKGKEWVLEAHIAERPKVSLKSYKSIVKKAQKQAKKDVKKQTEDMKKAHKKKAGKADVFKEPTEEGKKNFTLQMIYRDLVAELKPEIQELLVKEEVGYDLDNLNQRLKHLNVTFEQFLEQRKMTFDQLSGELAAAALGRLQMGFIIREIAMTESIKVEKEDIDAEFAKIKDEKLKAKQQLDPKYIDAMEQTLLRQKVADYLFSIK